MQQVRKGEACVYEMRQFLSCCFVRPNDATGKQHCIIRHHRDRKRWKKQLAVDKGNLSMGNRCGLLSRSFCAVASLMDTQTALSMDLNAVESRGGGDVCHRLGQGGCLKGFLLELHNLFPFPSVEFLSLPSNALCFIWSWKTTLPSTQHNVFRFQMS